MNQENNTPATISPRMSGLRGLWKVADDLMGGTATMRSAGRLYLPQEAAESDEEYVTRLNRTHLYNVYKTSIQRGVAKIFSNDIHVETTNELIKIFLRDVNLNGQDVTEFAKEIFTDAINRGVSYILVDHPTVDAEFDTLADERQAAGSPYWVSVPSTCVLSIRSAKVNGVEQLIHFRFTESVDINEGFIEKSIKQIRAFDLVDGRVLFTVWRQEGDKWLVTSQGTLTGQNKIPITPVYTHRSGFFVGTPPLSDLADLQILHWQSSSDQRNILHVARVPFLFMKGLNEEIDSNGNVKQVKVSVRGAIMASNPNADAKWIEHTGTSIKSGAEDLTDLEGKMEKMGMSITAASTPGGVTATERSISASEANSMLKSMALALGDALELALEYTCIYLNTPPLTTGSVTVNTRYAVDYASDSTFAEVTGLYERGLITKDDLVAEAKRRNLLDWSVVAITTETEIINQSEE